MIGDLTSIYIGYKSIDEILGMIAPLVEIVAFMFLDKAQRLDKKPLLEQNNNIKDLPKSIISMCRLFNPEEEKRIQRLYKLGYCLMYLGCVFWFLSSFFPFLEESGFI